MFIRRILDNEKDELIKIIGIGSGSTNTVCKLHKEGCKYQIISILSNSSSGIPTPDTKLVIGWKENHGLSTYKNLETGKKNFKESLNEIESIICGSTENFILVVNLGGGTGSSGILEMIDLISENSKGLEKYNSGRYMYIICSKPFAFEGKTNLNTDETLKQLEKYKNNKYIKHLIILDSNGIQEETDSLNQIFDKRDDRINKSVKQIIREIEDSAISND